MVKGESEHQKPFFSSGINSSEMAVMKLRKVMEV